MARQKEIKFRDRSGSLIGRQDGMIFIIRTEPGVIAGTPAHYVAVYSGDCMSRFSTLGHQYFHLAEAKEFCRQVAAGEVKLAALKAQYDVEDEVKILDADGDVAERVVLFRARLAAAGLSSQDFLELDALWSALGETGRQALLWLECRENDASCANPSCGSGLAI